MLASVVTLLNQHAIPQAIAARERARHELAELQRHLAEVQQKIPTWDRIVFFHDTEDEVMASDLQGRINALREQLDTVTRQADEALAQVFAQCPPVEIAHRVEQTISIVQADNSIARRTGEDDPIAAELEALASRVVDIWVPGFDSIQFGAALADPASRAAAASQCEGPLHDDPRLGWAPLSPAELTARAAKALASEDFARAQAAVAKEGFDHRAVANQLEYARKQVSTLDRLSPGAGPSEQAVAHLEKALEREYGEYVAATETFHLLLEQAMAAFPPMGIYLAALAAAGAIRSANPPMEAGIAPSGELGARADFASRAILLATLVQLRAAVDEAFPGLTALVSSRRARLRGPQDAGPYREAHSSGPSPVMVVSPDDALLDGLEDRGLRPVIVRGVSHASILGSLSRSRRGVAGKIGWSDRLAIWSQSDEKFLEARLRERESWHQTMFHWVCQQGTSIVDGAARGSARHALGLGTVAAHQAWTGIRTMEGQSSSPITCPAVGRADLLKALEYVRWCLEQGFGPTGDRNHLVHAVVQHLRNPALPSPVQPGAPPRVLHWNEIVVAIAEVLRPMGFLGLQERVMTGRAQYQAIAQEAQQARSAVTFLDKLNIFSDSPAEKRRDELNERTGRMFAALRNDEQVADNMLRHAMSVYPPAAVYYDLFRVVDAANSIHAVRHRGTSTTTVGKTKIRRTYYYCRLHGKEEAGAALRSWTRHMTSCFGFIPSSTELMERWVARALD